jgi:hypothetical protein
MSFSLCGQNLGEQSQTDVLLSKSFHFFCAVQQQFCVSVSKVFALTKRLLEHTTLSSYHKVERCVARFGHSRLFPFAFFVSAQTHKSALHSVPENLLFEQIHAIATKIFRRAVRM